MGLQQNLQNEPIKRLALRDALVVTPETTVRDAIGLMREKNLGCVIVVDPSGKARGTFTERELAKLLARDVESSASIDGPVGEHLSPEWAATSIESSIVDMVKLMRQHKLRFIVVVDSDGKPTALTGQKGLMEYVADYFPREVMVQRVGLKAPTEQREGA
ncbi:CBS domain protein [Planctomycetes bacterium Pan216]|uniref:CBS domain protein n=1 Tax=Kolteria novifilia TaxID=2527975 RepID=A0A518B9H2_9BACT|nr:CBS domain protein [Planctomycetes bacterium Pan216]